MTTHSFDIILCGGGHVGSCLALALAQQNISVAFIDSLSPEKRKGAEDNRIFALAAGSKKVLDDLKLLMDENPLIIIELSSHTDNIGSDKYNIDLSQRRAQSCVDYLISIGISRDRLVAKGYGKSAPIAPNNKPDGSDDPDGRAKNRRTAFKILGELKGKSSVNYQEKDGIKK